MEQLRGAAWCNAVETLNDAERHVRAAFVDACGIGSWFAANGGDCIAELRSFRLMLVVRAGVSFPGLPWCNVVQRGVWLPLPALLTTRLLECCWLILALLRWTGAVG
ncbi:unnamed protein product [Closterium sp. Yama58-4]|nr:unnamed protein product [Closterium sp. Yama58-4]